MNNQADPMYAFTKRQLENAVELIIQGMEDTLVTNGMVNGARFAMMSRLTDPSFLAVPLNVLAGDKPLPVWPSGATE